MQLSWKKLKEKLICTVQLTSPLHVDLTLGDGLIQTVYVCQVARHRNPQHLTGAHQGVEAAHKLLQGTEGRKHFIKEAAHKLLN